MSEAFRAPPDEGLAAAQRMKEEEELGLRRVGGPSAYLMPVIALGWSLFQLSLSSWLLLDSTSIRSIHLAFALAIVFLSYSTLKRNVRVPGLRWLGEKHKIPLADYLLVLIMFRPGFFARYLGIDNHHLSYLVGLAPWGGDLRPAAAAPAQPPTPGRLQAPQERAR
jgi:TRAP-type uncharacterized transport system fused permease subunit